MVDNRKRSIAARALEEVTTLLLPLRQIDTPLEVLSLLQRLGWPLPVDESVLVELQGVVHTLGENDGLIEHLMCLPNRVEALLKASSVGEKAAAVADLLGVLEDLIASFTGFAESTSKAVGQLDAASYHVDPDELTTLADRLVDYLLVGYLRRNHYLLYAVLRVFGLIDDNGGVDKIWWERVPVLLSDPGQLMAIAYGWGHVANDDGSGNGGSAAGFNCNELLLRLTAFANACSIPGGLYPQLNDVGLTEELRVPLYSSGWWPVSYVEAGFSLGPKTGPSDQTGIALTPYLNGVAEIREDISTGFQVFLRTDMDLHAGVELSLFPPHELGLAPKNNETPEPGGEAGTLEGRIEFGVRQALKGYHGALRPQRLLFGTTEGTHLGVRGFGVRAAFEHTQNTKEFFVEAEVDQLELALQAPKDDGFLSKLLGDVHLRAVTNLALGFSNIDGLSFQGSGALDIIVPVHRTLGPVCIEEVMVGLAIADGVDLRLAGSFSAVLGPVSACVRRLGIAIHAGFPEGRDGNLGPLHVSVPPKLLPPLGVGLSIDSAVSGGGFIDFDPDNKRYCGILALKCGDIGLVAIGLITTKMPDGSKGFAMLASMGVDFNPPIQLSMGFTLNKVGGLIGINRTMMVDVLREGIKKHTLDAILCPDPEWVIPNASKIISDLRTVFPPAEGHYVIGPMVQIGYGSPTIITADIGIFLEIEGERPTRALLLGKLKMLLPKPEEAIVKINLDIIGVLELEKKELSFQASLYDSAILKFAIFGDAAFFLSWGAKPEFAMSLGGFHPRFTSPQPSIVFADLKRLGINLSKGSNFQLSCGAYLALTPNSLQFGARAELYASAGKAELSGHLCFDTLIYFSPFRFEVDIGAGVTIRYRGASLADVRISLTLCGPSAWSARGTAHIKILFLEFNVDFNITWGRDEAPALDPVNPWPHFKEALLRAESWGGLLPESTHMVASLRKIEPEQTHTASGEVPSAAPVVVHPAGSLELRQNVVPLKTTLGKFGNAPLSGYDRFEITQLTTKDSTPIEIEDVEEIKDSTPIEIEDVEEFFSRGQFENLSDSQKLSVPAFEKMPGGIKTRSSNRISTQGEIQSTLVCHESIVINADRTSQRAHEEGISRWDHSCILSAGSASRRSALRSGRQARFAPTGRPLVATAQERYVIVKRETLQRCDVDAQADNWNGEGPRMHADQALLDHLRRHPEQSGSLSVIAAREAVEAA
jgi:hypothetical protein